MHAAAKKISTKADVPVILAFNILRPYYKEFGLQHYLPLKTLVQGFGRNIELFPILNLQYKSSIESRAAYIKEYLPEVLYLTDRI